MAANNFQKGIMWFVIAASFFLVLFGVLLLKVSNEYKNIGLGYIFGFGIILVIAVDRLIEMEKNEENNRSG
jgi:hypothetical protein